MSSSQSVLYYSMCCEECLYHDLTEDSDSTTDNKSSEYTDDIESCDDL